ncbi:AI-2E family transporter [Pontibacter locisalis]|uniref:AI-2E family transporter n=1 Tax=Pontibacter locisalis TaxID=1719035 RepID=A0ABW5IKJ0_9BACT
MQNIHRYAKRVTIAAFIVLLIATIFYTFNRHLYFFLLVFAGILLAVLLSGITNWFVNKLHVRREVGLLISSILFFGSIIGAFWLLAPTVGKQVQEMRSTVPEVVTQLEGWLSQYGWGQKIVEQMPNDMSKVLPQQQALFSRLSGVVSSTLSFLADLLIVIITGLFFAANPPLYTRGVAKLFPVRYRSRVLEVLQKCYETLKLWLVGMLAAMTIIGISTAIGYSLIGLNLAFALAFIAFLFAFIPNIGPWIAGIPVVLVSLTQGPQMVLYSLLVYGGIQLVESYWITPIIFQKTVDLPPALLLFVQVLFGIVQGGLGLLLAAPILAVIIVVVDEFYVKDFLESDLQAPSVETKSG